MEKLGYFFSEAIISHFKKRFAMEEKKMTSLWTDLFNISGFGKVQVVDITKEKTILKLEKNNFAELYTKEYGIQKQPVCHLLTGIFRNFIEKTSGKEVECKEISCVAMGNRVCTFELRTIQ